jgi:hypothetical protein
MSAAAPGVRELHSTSAEHRPGAISSSRCQTTRVLYTRQRHAKPSFTSGRAAVKRPLTHQNRHHAHTASGWLPPSNGSRRHLGCNRITPIWWSQTGSNRRPPACKAGALPAELWPLPDAEDFRRDPDNRHLASGATSGFDGLDWWAWEDLNLRPHAYQARALTN